MNIAVTGECAKSFLFNIGERRYWVSVWGYKEYQPYFVWVGGLFSRADRWGSY